MRFHEALKCLDEGKSVSLPSFPGYLTKKHNIITQMPADTNYRPTVTELNSKHWRVHEA